MTQRRELVGLLAAGALTIAAGSSSAQPAMRPGKRGLVVQVSEGAPANWLLALSNVRNVQDALGRDAVQIELVAYGPGIDMLKFDSVVNDQIDDIIARGVVVIACENTMIAQKVSRADMHAKIGFVRTGVLEIMDKQERGWSYLRP